MFAESIQGYLNGLVLYAIALFFTFAVIGTPMLSSSDTTVVANADHG
jgi:hypothetical protein